MYKIFGNWLENIKIYHGTWKEYINQIEEFSKSDGFIISHHRFLLNWIIGLLTDLKKVYDIGIGDCEYCRYFNIDYCAGAVRLICYNEKEDSNYLIYIVMLMVNKKKRIIGIVLLLIGLIFITFKFIF